MLVRRALASSGLIRKRLARSIASSRSTRTASWTAPGHIPAHSTCSSRSPGGPPRGADQQARAGHGTRIVRASGLARFFDPSSAATRRSAGSLNPPVCSTSSPRPHHARGDADGRRLARRSPDGAQRGSRDLPGRFGFGFTFAPGISMGRNWLYTPGEILTGRSLPALASTPSSPPGPVRPRPAHERSKREAEARSVTLCLRQLQPEALGHAVEGAAIDAHHRGGAAAVALDCFRTCIR